MKIKAKDLKLGMMIAESDGDEDAEVELII